MAKYSASSTMVIKGLWPFLLFLAVHIPSRYTKFILEKISSNVHFLKRYKKWKLMVSILLWVRKLREILCKCAEYAHWGRVRKTSVKESFLRNASATANLLFNEHNCSFPHSVRQPTSRLARVLRLTLEIS